MTNTGRVRGGPLDGAELSSAGSTHSHIWSEPGSDARRETKYHFVDGEWREEAMHGGTDGGFPPKGKPTRKGGTKRKPKGK